MSTVVDGPYCRMGQTLSAWIEQASGPACTVPAFMTMDGAYVAEPASQAGSVARWFGWLRLEGHGTFALKQSEVHADSVVGEWEVVDDRTARLKLAPRADLPSSALPPFTTLLLVEGDAVGTVVLRPDGASPGGQDDGCRMAFVPEEDPDDH